MLFVSVPGYSVHKYGKDRYGVAVANGNIGACVMNKEQFDRFVVEHDGKDYRNAAKKIAIGIGAAGVIAAGIIFRKPIAETAKKAFEAVKNSKVYQKTAEFVKDGCAFVKDKLVKVKDFFVNLFKKPEIKGVIQNQ